MLSWKFQPILESGIVKKNKKILQLIEIIMSTLLNKNMVYSIYGINILVK